VRLTEVRIEGLRSLAGSTVPLAPVTVLVGPNGGGKSTVLGAVAYALTGRYPGVVGVTADDLRPLARAVAEGFLVRLYAMQARRDGPDQELIIERGCGPQGHRLRTMGSGVGASRKVHDAEATILKHFGEPGFAVDAFDPERSIWRKSIELRTQWAFALCAGKAGWSHARLREELGEPTEDWDPLVSEEPATCLEINLARLDERLVAAQRVVREATKIADGIALVDAEPTDEEIATAEKKVEAASVEQQRLKAALASAFALSRDRARVQTELDAVNEELGRLKPPDPPAPADQAAIDAFAAFKRDKLEPAKLALAHADATAELFRQVLQQLPIGSGASCPVCNRHLDAHTVETLEARAGYAKQTLEELTRSFATLEAEASRLELAWGKAARHPADLASYDRALSAFASHRVTLQRSRDARQAELAALGVAIPGCKEADVGKAEQAKLAASQALFELRDRRTLAAERTGHREAARQAAARAEVLRARRDRMRAARERMLADGVTPLQTALGDLAALAPPGTHWSLQPYSGGIDFGHTGTRFVPIEMMSSSERYRATIALLVATAIVRRPPWVGIFLDGFEQVDPTSRDQLLVALASLAQRGLIDNAIVAMTEPPGRIGPGDVEGLRFYLARHGEVRSDPQRPAP
jgi:energy-coupling factor transporter ATP-binding protein EcfA2